VPLFQKEQVMRVGMIAANGLKTRLLEGMTTNGFDSAQQAEVMRILSTVREFMFPESHAHSFARRWAYR
jgi:error-prone DNA polymerase